MDSITNREVTTMDVALTPDELNPGYAPEQITRTTAELLPMTVNDSSTERVKYYVYLKDYTDIDGDGERADYDTWRLTALIFFDIITATTGIYQGKYQGRFCTVCIILHIDASAAFTEEHKAHIGTISNNRFTLILRPILRPILGPIKLYSIYRP